MIEEFLLYIKQENMSIASHCSKRAASIEINAVNRKTRREPTK